MPTGESTLRRLSVNYVWRALHTGRLSWRNFIGGQSEEKDPAATDLLRGTAQIFRKNTAPCASAGATFEMKSIQRRRNSISLVNFS
jgi:hypothetical protein